MKAEKSLCKVCGENTWGNNSKGVCPECVYKRNHGGKSMREVSFEKMKQKELEQKASGSPKKRIKVVFKKSTGEKELFEEIWGERAHYCQNENCNKFLGNTPNIQFFSHRKSKGARPELRLEKSNIDLLCCDCHHEWEFGDRNKIKLS